MVEQWRICSVLAVGTIIFSFTGLTEEVSSDDEGRSERELLLIYKGANTEKDNCSHLHQPFPQYNSSCELVQKECGGKHELIDYLAFILCDLPKVQPLGYVVMALWLVYLISLLATTVDYYFVPPLNFLSEKLHLSPSVAGVTLMALGNGAPDLFVVYSGVSQDDLALVLGSLAGAGIFITTIVLGTVMLVSKVWPCKLDRIDFMRDIIAFSIVVATVVGVAFDGTVYLAEACIFPLIYILYIAGVIALGYFRTWLVLRCTNVTEISPLTKSCIVTLDNVERTPKEAVNRSVISGSILTLSKALSVSKSVTSSLNEHASEMKTLVTKVETEMPNDEADTLKTPTKEVQTQEEKPIAYLQGLSWPKGAYLLLKIIWLVQWPFSVLRWLTIPSFYHDGYWSVYHYLLTSFSPLPISLLTLIAVKGWRGFSISVEPLPLPVILILIAFLPSLLLFILLRPHRPPHWSLQLVLVPSSFFMAVIWLNIIANEVVSVLKAFGLLLNINTAILGLTVLAIGNCVADWVADTVVTRAGKPEMAFASCFGSPLLSNALGLSIAMIVKIGFYNHGEPYRFHIHTAAYTGVKLSWIFLGTSLLASIIVFPIFKFSPPRPYGVVLIIFYLIFVVIIILGECHVIPIKL